MAGIITTSEPPILFDEAAHSYKKYIRDPDGALATLRKNSLREQNSDGPGGNDAIIIGVIFGVCLGLLVLTYFVLFLYNRLRHPKSETEDTAGILNVVARKPGARSETQNQIITKDELLARPNQDALEKTDHSWRGLRRGADTTLKIPSGTQSREGPSDAPSDGSEETSESGARYTEVPVKEETAVEVEDTAEKVSSAMSSERHHTSRVRLSAETSRPVLDEKKHRHKSGGREERTWRDYMPEYSQHYRLYVRRERKSGSGINEYEKHLWQ